MAENNVEIKSEEKTVVTKKVKNPANIEKGKKLVEWNKKIRKKFVQQKKKSLNLIQAVILIMVMVGLHLELY